MAWKSKETRNLYERRKREENREALRTYMQEYRARNKDKINARRRERREIDPEYRRRIDTQVKLYKRDWRATNRERERDKARKYYHDTSDRRNHLRREWRKKQEPESHEKLYAKEYNKRDDVKSKARQRALKRYYANRDQNLIQLRERIVQRWLKKAGWTKEEYKRRIKLGCEICGCVIKRDGKRGLVFDHCHETGIVRGLLCARCNKFLDWALKYYDEIGYYHNRSVAKTA